MCRKKPWPETVRYVRICSAGIVFITAYNGISGVFRALGNSRSPFLFVLIACLMNVALDLLFVGVFGRTPRRRAGTVIAQAASVFFSLAYTRRHPLPFAIGNPLRAGGAPYGASCASAPPSPCRIFSPAFPF